MSRRSLWSALAVAILSMGCSETSPETTVPLTTLPSTDSARCDKIGSQVIQDFVAAFNDGGIDLDQFFASGNRFQGYSDDQRVSNYGSRGWTPLYEPGVRTTLITYLDEARQRGPKTINSLTFKFFRELGQETGYAIDLEWEGHRHLGNVSVICYSQRINFWSLGPEGEVNSGG